MHAGGILRFFGYDIFSYFHLFSTESLKENLNKAYVKECWLE